MNSHLIKTTLCVSILAIISTMAIANEPIQSEKETETTKLATIVVQAAKDELKQDASLSVISKEVLEKQPISNDISEIVRTMPGVNLSGSSTSGQRGNQRQIDIRGMGPDNTLILIDGRPVTSRMSVRPGRAGEKDTRGDSQWVPPSAIERIEVLRGPAAARYGSGSMGGVINIITKSPTEQEASITGHYELPESNLEGSSWRTGINLAGPISEKLSYRTTLGYHSSKGDDPDINKNTAIDGSVAAGREGVENIDARQLFEYAINSMNTVGVELTYSEQSNKWAGDSQFQTINQNLINAFAGEKTNEMIRSGLALTHRGQYEKSKSNSYIEYNKTENNRLGEGMNGGGEGQISLPTDGQTPNWNKTKYETLNAKSEWDIFFDKHTLTTGAEFRGERLDNPIVKLSNQPDIGFGNVVVNPSDRDTKSDSYLVGIYIEDNYQVTSNWYVTPGLRFDYHSEGGTNWSPSLNTSWQFTDHWSVKGGISRAFKAPGLYQLDPNYLYYTRGGGCPSWVPANQRGCYVLGNPDLENETSWNKELTFTYKDDSGLSSGLTYYRNDFDNRVAAGYYPVATAEVTSGVYRSIFQWENQGGAIIEGIEAFLQMPITHSLTWNYNITGNIRSERKDNGEALSLIPKYTMNTSLGWDITDHWNSNLSASYYGEIEAPKKSGTTGDDLADKFLLNRKEYVLVNLNTQYKFNDHLSLGFGVKNLFDEQVKREGTSNNAGARTFNEPGRFYTFDVKVKF